MKWGVIVVYKGTEYGLWWTVDAGEHGLLGGEEGTTLEHYVQFTCGNKKLVMWY